jgi:4a-hydroxytetrahydrobiopterin dehydratase
MNHAPLADRHCVPCDGGTPTLTDDEIAPLLAELPGWKLDAEGRLARTYEFEGFMPGVRLVDRIAEVAEAEGHHPDLLLSWGSLTASLVTHAVGGLTENDFVLAAKIERLARDL